MRHLLLFILLFFSISSQGQTHLPSWVNGRVPTGKGYCDFIIVRGQGHSLDDARLSSLNELLHNRLDVSHNINLNVKLELNSVQKTYNGSSADCKEIVSEEFSSIITDNSSYDIRYKVIDEYVTYSGNEYSALVLYAVDNPNEGSSYRIIGSKDYRNSIEMFLSPIPGAAQFAKGSYLKGGLVLAGIAGSGLGIGLSQYQMKRAYTSMLNTKEEINKMRYARIANNMMITRNVCIGVMAGIYLYNIADAFWAPGKMRFKVIPYSNGHDVVLASSYTF